MIIPCEDIVTHLDKILVKKVVALKARGVEPTLTTILLGKAPEQLSFVRIKQKKAHELGITFDFYNPQAIPPFDEFPSILADITKKNQSTGVIIQHPLPAGYDLTRTYASLPSIKEIEGHVNDLYFQFPLSLAVLSGIKYVFSPKDKLTNSVVEFEEDVPFFQEKLQGKKIVIMGKGPTGGKPIAKAFSHMGIPFQVIDSKTKDTKKILKEADIIITATGKKVLTADSIKPGVVLLNVGLRKEEGRLKGDFDEREVSEIASWYNKTPGGLGPLDVSYLYKNLLGAAEHQLNHH